MAGRRHAHRPKARSGMKKADRKGAVRNKKEYEAANGIQVSEEQITHFANRITTFLNKANGRPVSRADLASKCRGKGQAAYLRALKKLISEGVIAERRTGYAMAAAAGMIRAVISRISRTYGFAKPEAGGQEIFIAGRDLKGACAGDLVLLMPTGMRDGTPEASVQTIIAPAAVQIAGMLVEDEGMLRLLPDTLCKQTLEIENAADWTAHIGDKVLATVTKRGARHSEHTVRVDVSLGSAETARACAEALVIVSGVPTDFPPDVLAEAERLEKTGIPEEELRGRLDLREPEDIIFTIDGWDAKDLDDAISIARTDTGYRLGVHIADVSHYVTQDSALDKEAISRGTSIYYADQVIPMLPKALSNGICSLHPDVDRLAFSALLTLDENGEITHYRFEKTVIRSAVKGVYREVNALLAGTASPEIEEKYASVKESLLLLNELREKRLAAREQRGAPSIEAEESAFLLDENGVCTEVAARTRGAGEELIEECMLLANEAAARLAKTKHLPFVYRVHAQPPEVKALRLAEALNRLDIPHPALDAPKPRDYAQVLKNAENSPLKAAVHQMVLRSMAKADYETEPVGHFGLALEDYAHFTSPIRRYPDLAIHRILTAYLSGEKPDHVLQFAHDAAIAGSSTEQRAVQLERDCEDCYRAEWAKQHIGESFDGVISGLTEFGIYVMLPNTAEGLVPIDALPLDAYTYDGFFSMHTEGSGMTYTLGMPMRVTVARADINSGNIDFAPAEP
ncbi:MAG: ribonuclease R [Oscillospiraceae bacterium]|nr:ribonuclease R [Oscillospiraceae bacterium]